MTTMNPPRKSSRNVPGWTGVTDRSSADPSRHPTQVPRAGDATQETPISVVDRVTLLLRAFASAGPMTLAQVTARTGLPRSSVHRLLDQLAAAGWLARSPEQTYELGIHAYEVGQAALRHNRLLQAATPAMRAFAQKTGYTVHLGVVDRGDTVYLAKINGRRSGPTPTAVGQRLPAHLTALGKAVMAGSSSPWHTPSRGRAVDDSSAPRRAASQFERELEEVRSSGAAFDPGAAFQGLACVGVSIGPSDHPFGNLAGLSMCASIGTFEPRHLVGPLRILAGEIWKRSVAADLAGH